MSLLSSNKWVWTLEAGLEFARKLEPIAIQFGFHIGLGGSVLHQSQSAKDLDIMVYPHLHGSAAQQERFIGAVSMLGIKGWRPLDGTDGYGNSKEIMKTEFEGKRIDFFFLS